MKATRTGPGTAWLGEAWLGEARQGKVVMFSMPSKGKESKQGQGEAWHGKARLGKAWHGKARILL